jgi:hypothetical protein
MASFPSELTQYVGRISQFRRYDWVLYLAWVCAMFGLCALTGGFLGFGRAHGVEFPPEAWLVPIGAFLFATSISIDTIGHRTVYRAILAQGEGFVHQITIFLGVSSVLLLVLAYDHRIAVVPAIVFTVLSFVYALIDEAFHWRRYIAHGIDRVEMWSHVGIFIGHGIMMLGWWWWYALGYPGVSQTVDHLQ